MYSCLTELSLGGGMTKRTVVQLVLLLSVLAFTKCGSTEKEPSPHLVTFISGDIVARPQSLSGNVGGGKASLSGTLEATYNFDKWIANFNKGDPAAFQILKEAQIAAGGSLTGTAQITVDASTAANSFIEVSVPVGETSYTIKIYTCVDYPHTTVTETATSIDVSQTGGTAAAYRVPVCSFANEGEDLVYTIQK
jgi:hypothetical protein